MTDWDLVHFNLAMTRPLWVTQYRPVLDQS